MIPVPVQPKIYHIVHIDRLSSIINDGFLWCDAEIVRCNPNGTRIGMDHIKQRRLNQLRLNNYPNLYVGDCVPFYFCPRSVMLYLIYKQNYEDLDYQGGQEPIIHLKADLHRTIEWAEKHSLRWVFTLSNAGTLYFEDRCNLAQLNEINWASVQSNNWSDQKEGKQAEFLIEKCFPWQFVEQIGVFSQKVYQCVERALAKTEFKPQVDINPEWYY